MKSQKQWLPIPKRPTKIGATLACGLFSGYLLMFPVSCSSVPIQIEPPLVPQASFSVSGETPLPDQWWLSFNDPVLNKLIDKALTNNFNLRSAWDRLAQAEASARKSGAERYPGLNAQAQSSRTRSYGGKGTSSTGQSINSFNRFSVGLAAGYELDLWGRIRSTHKAAGFDVRATEEDLRAAAITLTAQVATTWYQLIEQYAQLELLNHQLETNKQVVELVTIRFRSGQAGAADLLQQRQFVESGRGEIALAESSVSLLEHQLAILLGQPPKHQIIERKTDLVQLPGLPETGIPADLIQRRPDIRRAYFEVLAADQRTATAIAERFPRISLRLEGSTSSEQTRDLFDNWLTTLAANLIGPLIDGGSRRAAVDRMRAVTSQTLNNYGQVILDSLREVEDALAQERQQRELIGSLNKQKELSRAVIQRIRDSYKHGAVDYLRVLDALLTDQRLERSLLEERRKLIEYRINLCRALGGGWALTQPEPNSLSQKNPAARSITLLKNPEVHHDDN